MNEKLRKLQERAKFPAASQGMGTVKAYFELNKTAMAAVLPRHVSSERMLRIALSAMRATPKLMECTTESLMSSVMVCSQLGLEPNTPQGHAYLVPFAKGRGDERTTEVQVIIGYKGLIDLARRSGQIVSIAAHTVHENDEFDFSYGLENKLQHTPALSNRGEIIAFYAVAHLQDGGNAFEVMSKEQVDGIMATSQSRGKYGPWKDHYSEMGRKTAIRRLSKYLPMSIEMASASRIDEQAEAGEDQGFDSILAGEYEIESQQETASFAEIEDAINSATTQEAIDTAVSEAALAHLPDDQKAGLIELSVAAIQKINQSAE